MGDWLFNLPVFPMAAIILGAIYLATAALYYAIMRLGTGERARAFKAISPGMLPPLSVVFALLVGFLAAQVWSDSDRAGAAVHHEASAIRAVVLLAAAFPGEPEARLRELMRDHVREVVSDEWPAMVRRNVTLALAPQRLVEALHIAIALPAPAPGQVAAQRELVSALEGALEARRQRIILSRTSVNWIKWTVLLLQAGLMLITIAMVHIDNPLANRIILGIFATSVGVAVVLIAAHSRPFAGGLAVSPTYLLQVAPETGMTARR
ncbi:MAG TPA: hypothetical protein VEB59_14775 [Gemmatimonadales bacterium]|nr:hypothetical protein [Gemmatimonadales bacterium]